MLAGYGFLSWPVIFLDLGIFSLFLGGMALCRLPSRWQGYGQAGLIAILFCGSAVHTFNTQKLALLSFVEHRGDFKQQLDTLSYNRYAFTPKTYAVLTGNAQDTRDYQVEYTVLDQSLWESVPNMAMVGHEFVARGYESIYLNNFYSFYWLTSFQPGPASSHILDLLGVKYLVSLWPVSSPGFDLVKQNVWQIYKNNNAFPRVFLVNKEVVTADLAGTMHRMQEHISYGTTARIIHYDLNRVTIEAESGPDSTLVLTDTFYSGWRASVDGGPARIFPAFYMFRGIDLPAGKHEIIFTYRPDYFYPALLVTLLAILTSIGYFLRELKAWSQDK